MRILFCSNSFVGSSVILWAVTSILGGISTVVGLTVAPEAFIAGDVSGMVFSDIAVAVSNFAGDFSRIVFLTVGMGLNEWAESFGLLDPSSIYSVKIGRLRFIAGDDVVTSDCKAVVVGLRRVPGGGLSDWALGGGGVDFSTDISVVNVNGRFLSDEECIGGAELDGDTGAAAAASGNSGIGSSKVGGGAWTKG